jgi:hypothetical protein
MPRQCFKHSIIKSNCQEFFGYSAWLHHKDNVTYRGSAEYISWRPGHGASSSVMVAPQTS